MFGFVELAGWGKQRELAIVVFDVVNIDVGVQHGLQHPVFVIPLEGQNRQVIKQMGDRTGRTQFGAGLGEAISDVGDRPVCVVGQAVDDD